MEILGKIEGMNFSPISGYNNFLNKSDAFSFDENNDFEKILSMQSDALTQNQPKIHGKIEVNTDFNRFFVENAPNVAETEKPGHFLSKVSDAFGGGLESLNGKLLASEHAQEALAAGEDISVHDVMIAAEKASLGMNMAIQLRNKLITAYNEINNVKV